MTGTANNGWEDSPGGVITSETSFAHAGAIINDKSSNVFVTHVVSLEMRFFDENINLSSAQDSREVSIEFRNTSAFIFYSGPKAKMTQKCKDVSVLQIQNVVIS